MILLIAKVIFLSSFFIFSIIAFFFFISVFTGAPYVGTSRSKMDLMFSLVKIKKDDKFVDLGSGDGRLVIEAAKLGAMAEGVEINPGLYAYSVFNIYRNKLANKAKIHWGSLFSIDYSKYDIIMIAGFIGMMKRLEKEFDQKLKKGTKVVCYAFPLPNKKPVFQQEGVYFYQY